MNIELLTIYTLSADGQTFSQFLVDGEPVKLLDYDYVSERMGSTSLTATLKHAKCLDSYWTGREFVVLDEASLQGGTPVGSLEAFFLSHTPSSSKDNTDSRYVHTLEFKSRRDILLSGVYFRDSVAAGSASAGKFSSDDYKVTFFGTLDEFVARFSDVLTSLGLQSRFSVSVESAYQGTTESKELSFDKKTLAEALSEAYSVWKVPYYFSGDSAVFGDGGAVPLPVQYGPDDELLSVQKNNQNAKIVTRITGKGSSENVPYYYPNPTPKGWLSAGGTAEGVEVVDMKAFAKWIGLSDVLTYMGRDAEYVSVSVTGGYATSTSQGSDTTAALEDLSVVSGKKQTFGARLTSDLSGGYVGALEMGLYAPMGCAAGIDPDAPIRHFWSQDDDPSTPQAGSIRAASLVCDKGWDIVVDRVKLCLGDGMSLSNPHEVEVSDFDTVTVSNDVAPEDKGLFADEKVVGVRVSADAVRAYVESLPAGSDLSRVTLVVIGHLQTHVLWMLPPDGQGSGWENVDFVAERLQVSKESYTPMGWYVGGSPLGMTLAEVGLSIEGEPEVGDTITQVVTRKIPATGCIMPSIYVDTDGASRFYEATDTPPEAYAQAYVNPETGENYDFEHQYDALEPHEHVEDFDDVKPTIKNLQDGQGNPLNVLSDVYFDDGYNIDDTDADGNLRYSHFFVKLKALGFNIFDCAIEDGEMAVVMSDGPCAGCHFRILVTEDGKNPVQKNANGTLKKVDGYGVIDEGNIQPNQQDTTSNAVWVALLQDDSTFGGTEVENGVMPNYNKTTGAGQRPMTDNSYTLENIDLPDEFLRAAERELDRQLVGFMAENNADKFQYPVAFSRVYLAENPSVREGLSVRSSLLLTYAGVTLPAPLYVSQMTVSVKEGEALPDIRVETSDIIETRTAGLDEKIASAVDARVVFGGSGGGLTVDVTDARYLRKDVDDVAEGVMTFRKGVRIGNYIPGAGGIGGSIYTGKSGEAIAEVDILRVRRKAVFTQVEVDSMRKVGGTIMLTLADMKISAVEEVSGGWKCYFKSDTADGGALENAFRVDDQAICQTFGNDNTHYYWRLVTEVGPDWIVLSSGHAAAGSDAPEVGDTVVQLGNQSDPSRRAAQVLSCYGEDSPSFVIYAGIDSFSLAGKAISGFVYTETAPQSGVYKPLFFNYGPMFIGDEEGDYIAFDPSYGMTMKATVVFKPGQVIPGLSDLDYLKDALPLDENQTLIAGGLILSKTIALTDAQNRVTAGINGLTTLSDIAAWYGGELLEKSDWEAMTPGERMQHTFAKTVFRFDGSGYMAAGNIYWDEDGYGGIPGITWSREAGQTIVTIGANVRLESMSGAEKSAADLVNAANDILSWFEEVNFGTEQQPIWGLRLKRKTVNGVTYERAFVTYGDQVMNGATIGPGGGGGGATYLYELTDVLNYENAVGRFNGTTSPAAAHANDLMAYNGSKWYAVKLGEGFSLLPGEGGVYTLSSTAQGNIRSVVLEEGTENGTVRLNVNGNTGANVDVHGLGDLAFKSTLVASDIPNLSATYQPRNGELDAIAQLTSGGGLLKRAANGTWSLDDATYISSVTAKTLTFKVGGATKGAYNVLEDVTIDISGPDIVGAIGNNVYHPHGGASNLDLTAQYLRSVCSLTVGNGSNSDSDRRVYFGGLSHYIELKDYGTPGNPLLGFHLTDPLVTSGDQVMDGGGTLTPGGGGGGGGTPHVLLSQEEWSQLQNPDSGTIYLIYE